MSSMFVPVSANAPELAATMPTRSSPSTDRMAFVFIAHSSCFGMATVYSGDIRLFPCRGSKEALRDGGSHRTDPIGGRRAPQEGASMRRERVGDHQTRHGHRARLPWLRAQGAPRALRVRPPVPRFSGAGRTVGHRHGRGRRYSPVSYTHLTLPT